MFRRRASKTPASSRDLARLIMTSQVPHHLPRFVDRTALLAEVDGLLGQGGPVVLVGAPGAGTTQVAASLARRELARGRDVFWLNGRSEHSLAGDLGVLAGLLGISRLGQPNNARNGLSWLNGTTRPDGAFWNDTSDLAALHEWSPAGNLLVVDGGTDPAVVRRWLPSGDRLRVLVTTDDPALSVGTRVAVGGLTPDEALTLLGAAGDAAGGRSVLDEIGRLPLYVSLAATTMRVDRIGFDQYLDRLRAEAAESGSVEAAVLRLAVSALVPDMVSVAGFVARHLALLSPAGADQNFVEAVDLTEAILSPEKELIEDRNRAVGAFIQHGVLTMNVHNSSLIMHPLVQATIREMAGPGALTASLHLANKMFERELPAPEAGPVSGTERWRWEHAITNVDALLAAASLHTPTDQFEVRLRSMLLALRARGVAYLLSDGDVDRASEQLRLLAAGADELAGASA